MKQGTQRREREVWIVLDQRAILDPDEGIVLDTGNSRREAIQACKSHGGGCVYGPDGGLEYWLDGDENWDLEESIRQANEAQS